MEKMKHRNYGRNAGVDRTLVKYDIGRDMVS